jgi:cell wall assembly regulator SMI1
MQEFTRSLTREIQVDGERLAVTLDKEGLSIRPVGSRRPPSTLSWTACLCAAVGNPPDSGPDQVAAALATLKGGRKTSAAKTVAAPAVSHSASPPAHKDGQTDLAGLLKRIDHGLSAHRQRFVKALEPGATPQQLDDAQKQLGRPLPEELRTLLAWHNGQNPDVFGAFEQVFYLMSAGQIAETAAEIKANPPAGWKAGWLPFLDDDADSFVVVDTEQPGLPVREVWRGRTDHSVVAPSLKAWLQRFAEGLEHGAYVEDPERGTFLPKS